MEVRIFLIFSFLSLSFLGKCLSIIEKKVFKMTFSSLLLTNFFNNILFESFKSSELFKKYLSYSNNTASPKSERLKNTFLCSKSITPSSSDLFKRSYFSAEIII